MKKIRRAQKEYKKHQMNKTINRFTIERELLLSTVVY